MRKLLDSIVFILGVVSLSTVGSAMEIPPDQNPKGTIHHDSIALNEIAEAESPLKKRKIQNSDDNPLLFRVLNLTPDTVDYHLSAYLKNNGFFYDDYEKSLQPKSLLHHIYLNDHPELQLSSSQLENRCIFPSFKRQGCDGNEYSPNLSSSLFSWGRVYILCPVDISKNDKYVSKNINCFISSDFPDFKGLMYLFSADENCLFKFLPAELKLAIFSKTFTLWPDKSMQ